MRAVVLVGGFGTRLRPLTLTTPKPMLPVDHRPILELVVDNLRLGGVTEAVLSIGFRPDAFLEAYPTGICAGVQLSYAVEPEPLDTGGAIAFAARSAGIDDTFVAVNGDVLTDLHVGRLVEFHRSHGSLATIHLTEVDDPSAFGVADVDPAGRVCRFVEKPPRGEAPSHLVNAGTYVLDPAVLERIPEGRRVSIERETFPSLVADGAMWAMATDDYWLDAGRPDQYLQANLDAIDGRRERPMAEPIGEGAALDPDAKVLHSVIGARARIEAGAVVVDSVVLDASVIGRDARVERSVLAPRTRIGAGATVVDAVLGEGAEVEPGEVLSGVSRPEPA